MCDISRSETQIGKRTKSQLNAKLEFKECMGDSNIGRMERALLGTKFKED